MSVYQKFIDSASKQAAPNKRSIQATTVWHNTYERPGQQSNVNRSLHKTIVICNNSNSDSGNNKNQATGNTMIATDIGQQHGCLSSNQHQQLCPQARRHLDQQQQRQHNMLATSLAATPVGLSRRVLIRNAHRQQLNMTGSGRCAESSSCSPLSQVDGGKQQQQQQFAQSSPSGFICSPVQQRQQHASSGLSQPKPHVIPNHYVTLSPASQARQQQQQQQCGLTGTVQPQQQPQRQHQQHSIGRQSKTSPCKYEKNLLKSITDPVLLSWLKAMRYEAELECLSSLQARTLAIDEYSAGALSVRNSQVAIQELRAESGLIIDFIDDLIDCLPLQLNNGLQQQQVADFHVKFTELYTRLVNHTATQVDANRVTATTATTNPTATRQANYLGQSLKQNNLAIINCTPRKSSVACARTLRPLDKLAVQLRSLCLELAKLLCGVLDNIDANQQHLACHMSTSTGSSSISSMHQQHNCNVNMSIDNEYIESTLRKIKELYGQFIEISISSECAHIVRALYYDFSLDRVSSSSSLRPARPFESGKAQLPLKWALIALWQLTIDDRFMCRMLTELKLELNPSASNEEPKQRAGGGLNGPVARRLDYSTKYDSDDNNNTGGLVSSGEPKHALQSDYEQLYRNCQRQLKDQQRCDNDENTFPKRSGALSNALAHRIQSRDQLGADSGKQVTTIESLIHIIISQPNKHERLDMIPYLHQRAQTDKLIDLEELDQSVSAAIFTSNQYKVAALRILNHMCINEQAIKTILKCFSTPPPKANQPIPENKIIRSIFECFETSQEHIYQNEPMLNPSMFKPTGPDGRKRSRRQTHQSLLSDNVVPDEFSDYGSRQTGSLRGATGDSASGSHRFGPDPCNSSDSDLECVKEQEGQDSDDVVVKEAIRLFTQLTTPFHKSNQGHDFYTLIGRFTIESLVKYMTNIIRSTKSREMLFLTLTTLANISFITTEPMRIFGTNRTILEMFRSSKQRSKDLELRDQAVTILANAADKNLMDVLDSGGLSFLLSCLESCPTRMANYRQKLDQFNLTPADSDMPMSMDSNYNQSDDYTIIDNEYHKHRVTQFENKPRDRKPIDYGKIDFIDDLECICDQQTTRSTNAIIGHDFNNEPIIVSTNPCLNRLSSYELEAKERIHQKAAVAFARMSCDTNTTQMFLRYGGVKQLIDLCKISHKRNHSDTVLIACIAALRKVSKALDKEVFRHYNALDLIELDLNQALEIYGKPHESLQFQQSLFASDV